MRRRVARALGRIGAADAVAALAAALSDERIGRLAAEALGRIGRAAAAAVPALAAVAADPDGDCFDEAARALARIGTPEVVPVLRAMLAARTRHWSDAPIEAIGLLDPETAAPAVPDLVRLLSEKSAPRVAVVNALRRLRTGVPALVQALRDRDRNVRLAAFKALADIGGTAAEAVPALIRAGRNRRSWMRFIAARTLGEIGPKAAAGIPTLIRLLADPEPGIRAVAAAALGRIGPDSRRALPKLAGLLTDRTQPPDVRKWAALGIRRIGADVACLPALIAVIEEPAGEAAKQAVAALIGLGPDAAPPRRPGG